MLRLTTAAVVTQLLLPSTPALQCSREVATFIVGQRLLLIDGCWKWDYNGDGGVITDEIKNNFSLLNFFLQWGLEIRDFAIGNEFAIRDEKGCANLSNVFFNYFYFFIADNTNS